MPISSLKIVEFLQTVFLNAGEVRCSLICTTYYLLEVTILKMSVQTKGRDSGKRQKPQKSRTNTYKIDRNQALLKKYKHATETLSLRTEEVTIALRWIQLALKH